MNVLALSVILVSSWLVPSYSQTNNLVRNPGFEDVSKCPGGMPSLVPLDNKLPYWEGSHSEFFTHKELFYFGLDGASCSTSNNTYWPGFISAPYPRGVDENQPITNDIQNKSFAGFWFNINSFSYRLEYLTGTLIDPLIPGITYDVSYWVQPGIQFTNLSSKKLGGYFHQDGEVHSPLTLGQTSKPQYHLDVDPDFVDAFTEPGLENSYHERKWYEVSGQINLDKTNITKFSLGFFHRFSQGSPQEGVDYELTSTSSAYSAYYFLDDVSVTCDSQHSVQTNVSGNVDELALGGSINEISCEEFIKLKPVLENTHRYEWMQEIVNIEDGETYSNNSIYNVTQIQELNFLNTAAPLNEGFWEGLQISANLGSQCHSGPSYDPGFKYQDDQELIIKIKNLDLDVSVTSSVSLPQTGDYDLVTSIDVPTNFQITASNFLPEDGLVITIEKIGEQAKEFGLQEMSAISWKDEGEYLIKFFNKYSKYCHKSYEFKILVTNPKKPLYVPNAFSPNFDGRNDVFAFYPKNPEFYSNINLKVFSRWGDHLFEIESDSIQDVKWDGTSRGEALGSGVYAYVLTYRYTNGALREDKISKGEINLLK